ncbi:MAG TPA: hypothetical protein VGL83_18750 [Stellaceae bacterium]|jgi:hypothetical protein
MDPSRDQFGVSAARPDDAGTAAPAAPELAALDQKAHKVCTLGYDGAAPTIQPADNGQQLVDQKLRCQHYDRLTFDYVHMDWSNLF